MGGISIAILLCVMIVIASSGQTSFNGFVPSPVYPADYFSPILKCFTVVSKLGSVWGQGSSFNHPFKDLGLNKNFSHFVLLPHITFSILIISLFTAIV